MIFPDRPAVFAHRGFSARAPENTLSSFRLALEGGADGIELDVHRCATGEIVVVHDGRLERTAGLAAAVERTPWETIRTLDAGSWFHPRFASERIPLLADVLDELGGKLLLDIEMKAAPRSRPSFEAAVVEEIVRRGLQDRCFVSSFNPLSARRAARLGHGVETAVIYAAVEGMPLFLRRGQGRFLSGSRILKPHHSLVTPRLVDHFRERRGLRIVPWTVDDQEEARRLAALGVDGIVTNDPEAIREALRLTATWGGRLVSPQRG